MQTGLRWRRLRMRASGVVLSTGRVVRSCRKIMQQLSLDGCHIFYDGALVSDPAKNKEIYSQPIEPELVAEGGRAIPRQRYIS